MIKTAAKSLACGVGAALLAMQLGATGPVVAQEAEECRPAAECFPIHVAPDVMRLGVDVIGVGDSLGDYFGVEVGATVASIVEDSPAERAGMLAGDVIIGVGDVEIGSPDELWAALSGREPGEVGLNIIRHGEERVLSVDMEDGAGPRFFYFSSDGHRRMVQAVVGILPDDATFPHVQIVRGLGT